MASSIAAATLAGLDGNGEYNYRIGYNCFYSYYYDCGKSLWQFHIYYKQIYATIINN